MIKDLSLKILINTFSVFLVALMLPGIHLENIFTAILVAIALALFNTFLRPLLILMTMQVTVLMMGVFLLIFNAGMVLLAGEIVSGFEVASFWTAFWFSILMSIVSFFLGLPEKIRKNQIMIRRVFNNFDEELYSDDKSRQFNHSQEFQDAEIVVDNEFLNEKKDVE
jgi:putative membrane protein